MRPNRPRVYEAADVARSIRETFADRAVVDRVHLGHHWPHSLQHIGDSLAVAYASDKWQPQDRFGRRKIVDYLHLAESRNRCFAVPGLIYDEDRQDRAWPVCGPMVSFERVPMPRDYGVLALFMEIRLQLHVPGPRQRPVIRGDEGIIRVRFPHAILGASEIQWSQLGRHDMEDEPFLFVYTERDGILLLVVGDELDIEKDGIVG